MTTSDGFVRRVDVRRFPALERLVPGRRKIPVIQQMEAADCGAACLAMVLAYHGHAAPLREVRAAAGTSAAGTDASSIARAAESFGLRSRGLRLDMAELVHLAPASILHWDFNHFVVFERVSRDGVHVVDPSLGRRCVPIAKASRAFTGVAIELAPNETFAPRKGERGTTLRFMRELVKGTGGLTRILSISLLFQLFALALPVLTGLIVDRVVPRGDTRLLLTVGFGLGALVLFQGLSSFVRSHLLLQLRTNLDTRMTLGFLDHLVSLPYAFFQRRSTGDLLMRVSSNQVIRELLTSQTLSALIDGVLVTVYIGIILLVDSLVAAIVLALAAVQLAILLASRSRVQELEAQSLEARAKSQSYLVQVLGGIATLKLAGAERRAVQRWSHELSETLNADLAMGRTTALVDALLGALRTASPLIILSYGAVRVIDGEMSLGTMLAVNALAGSFLTPVGNLVTSALALLRVRGHLDRLQDVLEVEPEHADDAVAPPPLSGDVELDGVTFRYRDDGPPVLRDVSLSIRAGQSVAIVGPSGSGKTTLASLLLGVYPPTEGRILFDGRDLANLDLRAVRAQLGTVPQEPYFFDASIRDNVALADPDAPLDRVIAACKLACIHRDIAAMPMRYESLLADRGTSLSGGQRQRLALARALLARPSLLVLDEATSALDTETEARVTANLSGLRMTRVFVAHRLSTVVDADVIIVVDGGRVIETGSHAHLLAANGRYAALVAAQLEDDSTPNATPGLTDDPNATVVWRAPARVDDSGGGVRAGHATVAPARGDRGRS